MTSLQLGQFIPYLLYRISRRLNAHLREEMRRESVTIHRWRILAVLSAHDGLSLSELATYTVKEQSVISRVAEQMVKDDLVRREADPADRRVVRLFLTQRGRRLFDRVFPVAQMHHRRATGTLTATEQKTLVRLLHKMLAGIGEKDFE
jgi:DNA-binding MarR family transcriptional regulator